MKKISLILTMITGCLPTAFATAPTVITFTKDARQKITVQNPQPSYKLPIKLHIAIAVLTGKTTLAFYVDGVSMPAIPAYTISQLTANGGFYDFDIDSAKLVSPCNTGQSGCKITKNAFTIKVDGVSAGTINLSNGQPQPAPPNPGTLTKSNPDNGYPVYDALFLGGIDFRTGGPSFIKVFQYYNITRQADLENNPFFKGQFPNLYNGPEAGGISIAGLLSSVGDADVTEIADGLAKFIVARMKEELSVAFFSKFKSALDKPAGKKLQILFPTTYTVLEQIDKEVYNYPQYLQTLRGAFQKDLALMLPDLQQLINDKDFLAGYPKVKTILSDAAFIAQEFKNGTPPGGVLNDYLNNQANKTSLDAINDNIYPSLQTLNLVSQSLRSKYGKSYWVSADTLSRLFVNELTPRLYFGFLYQQLLNVPGGDISFPQQSLKAFLIQQSTNINQLEATYKPYLSGIFDKAKTVDAYFLKVKNASKTVGQQPDYADYYGLVSATTDLIKQLEQCPALAGLPNIAETDAKINAYLDAIKGLSGIYVDLYYKQYPAAIVDISTLFKGTLIAQATANYDAKSAELTTAQAPGSATAQALPALKIAAQALNDTLKKYQALLDDLVKYGNFVATVASAQSSDDVQKAIEAVALPAGSASVKRHTLFNIALNAYIGPYYGWEKVHDFDKNSAKSYGLTAPVGVSFSAGNTPWKDWSVSAFVSLIDIGAIASYRLGNNTATSGTDTLKASKIPQVKLKNIVSPGLFFSLGFPSVPVSLQFGYQLAPALRAITVTNSQNQVLDPNTNGLANQYASKLYSRWSVGLVVDIPIINLFTSSK